MTRDEKINANIGLVHACAKRFVGKGIEYDDLYSSGCVGLIKAIDNFDESKGFKLSTYAVPVILGEIKRLFRDGGSVKISRSIKELSLKAKKICDDYKKNNGCDIPVSTLSKMLGIDIYKTNEVLLASQSVLSLSHFYDDDNSDFDIKEDSVEESLVEKMSLFDALSKLDQNDKRLIELRYFQHKTQSQTAQIMNMTQVSVSRREKKILSFMRQTMSG